MIKLVIFDFDGVLVLTEEETFIMENFIAKKLGFTPMTRDAHQKNWGKPVKEAILERIPGIDPEEFIKTHKEVLPEFVREGKLDVLSEKNKNTIR